ncbi:MAG: hypothetical protein AAB441_04780 [Patescibacteria group bacterium]
MPETFQTRLKSALPQIQTAYAFAQKNITEDLLFFVAQRLSDVRAPSGTVSFTIGPVIKSVLENFGVNTDPTVFTPNYLGTGDPVFEINPRSEKPPVFFFAHGDEVSYLVKKNGKGEAVLEANCAHRQAPAEEAGENATVQFPGQTLRYGKNPAGEIVAEGNVITDQRGRITFVTDRGSNKEIKKDDIIIFDPLPDEKHRLKREGNNAIGMIDNRIGLAATLLMAITMDKLKKGSSDNLNVKTVVVADDREEGPPTGAFGLGAQAFANAFYPASGTREDRYIVVDGHDAQRDNLPPEALLSKVVSKGKGAVMDNQRVDEMKMLIEPLNETGVHINWDESVGVTTSRSSDWGLKKAGIPDSQIVVAGYSEAMPHHNDLEPAVASITSAVELSRFLVALNVAASFGLI